MSIKNYIKVYREHFGLLRMGDYIRWEKLHDEGISAGGAIIKIGKTKNGKKNWRLKKGDFEFQLYWETLEFIWLKKHPYFNILEEKISILSASLAFIVKELDIEEEFIKFDAKLKKTINLRRTKSAKLL